MSYQPLFLGLGTAVFRTNTDTNILEGETADLRVGQLIKFTSEGNGFIFGGVVANTVYYIKEIVNSNEFKISATLNGDALELNDGEGFMLVRPIQRELAPESLRKIDSMLKEIYTGGIEGDGVGILSVQDDTSPMLGGNLSLDGNDIVGTGDINISGTINATVFSGGFRGTLAGSLSGPVDDNGVRVGNPSIDGLQFELGNPQANEVIAWDDANQKFTLVSVGVVTGTDTLDDVLFRGNTSSNSITVSRAITPEVEGANDELNIYSNWAKDTGVSIFSGTGTESVTLTSNRIVAVVTNVGPSQQQWIFETDGDLILPSSGDIKQNGSSVLFSGDYADLSNTPTVIAIAPQWTANHTLLPGGVNTRYLANDAVYDNGNIFRALFDNESLPTNNTEYWDNLGPGSRLNIDGRDIPNITYDQLNNLPTIPADVSDLTDTTNLLFSGSYLNLTDTPVLFSGSYTDLSNTPTIPTDVNQLADVSGLLGGDIGDFTFTNSAATVPVNTALTLTAFNNTTKESKLTLSPTTVSSLYAANNLELGVGYGTGGELYWQFGADGSLTLPSTGDIIRNGVSVLGVADTNTTYSISAVDGTSGKKIIRLTAGGSGSGDDDVTLVAGTNVTLDRIGDEITINSSGGGGTGLGSRTFPFATTGALAINAVGNINITGFKTYALLAIIVEIPAWVRVYSSAAARTADAARLETVDPSPGSGVIAEVITTTNNQTILFTPATIGFNSEDPAATTVYLAVKNKGTGVATIEVTLALLQLEA